MAHAHTTILITGSNQGLGYHVVEKLLTQADHLHVYVAARTVEKAKEAVRKLTDSRNIRPSNTLEPMAIDLTDDSSIEAAVQHIKELDILVNNAGAYVKEDFSSPQATRRTLNENFSTNLFGTAALTTACLPKLDRKDAKFQSSHRPAIINVTSGLASFANMTTPTSPQYNSSEIFYSSSKTALNAFTVWLSKQYPSIRVVAVAPGHSATALNGFNAPQTAETGAQYIVDAILDRSGPTGVYMQRNKKHDW